MININTAPVPPLRLALDLAANGWHVFPLNPRDKRPLANCLDCRDNPTCSTGDYRGCPCLPDGQWCHGVRAATTNPDHITTWWRRVPGAVPAIATGPSRLILIDLDTHTDQPPPDPATQLLPGIRLTPDQVPGGLDTVRDGADVLRLLAHLRGRPHPWPAGPEHQPVSVVTPSSGRHLWYRAPDLPDGVRLRQALGELGWQIDIKAAWSYGIAPGATTPAGTYTIRAGTPVSPGQMPDWLTREILRVIQPPPRPPAPPPTPAPPSQQQRAAAYLTTVIERGTTELATLTDGRKTALSALAFKAGGLLTWAGLNYDHIHHQLVNAGIAAGLDERAADRIVHRALTNGLARPLPEPRSRAAEHTR
ncbi:bifunctional DNA primase/polymerase [Actinomadura rudentiformis]|uniref:Bifunctional DNA primase/polymerase n=1 Tax=Actinomadura rudentiformis TaxID=359158 RepID=A0A6H9YTD1_9ACTN|nr:bifunctional DNA primase/polymerase [Actinomadura rudentiformis]KAB2351620.1 bifunctional DNA primase/polymerase [Actinomadura rudentiformis]